MAAARMQLEPNMAIAMLYERGLIALEAQSKVDAEKEWNELLEVAIIAPRTQTTKRSTANAAKPAEAAGQPVLRKLEIRGKPTIPREVRLVEGDRLEGWRPIAPATMQNSLALREARFRQTATAQNPPPNPNVPLDVSANLPANLPRDWTAENGVLRGQHVADADRTVRTSIQYHRPLPRGSPSFRSFRNRCLRSSRVIATRS